MKAIFRGKSKHYTTGKSYNINSKMCKIIGKNIESVLTVYNMDDENAAYKYENSNIVFANNSNGENEIIADNNQPYRIYFSIEDFLNDWELIN